jgi:hypothetical protein
VITFPNNEQVRTKFGYNETCENGHGQVIDLHRSKIPGCDLIQWTF